jgi:hypothetical protein
MISQAKYARRHGVARSSISRAVRDGRIPTKDGKINPRVADDAWRKSTDPSKVRNRRKSGSGQGSGSQTYASSRALRESFQAKIKRLEYEELVGELVRVEVVQAAWFKLARRARDLLLAIPDRLAPILAAITEPAEVQRKLTDELRRVCEQLSGEP